MAFVPQRKLGRSANVFCASGLSVARVFPQSGAISGCATIITGCARDGNKQAILSVWNVKPADEGSPSALDVTLRVKQAHPTTITELQCLDETTVVTGDADGAVRVWNFDVGSDGGPFSLVSGFEGSHAFPYGSEPASVTAISVGEDGSFASVGEDGRLLYYSVSPAGGEVLARLSASACPSLATPLTCATHVARRSVVAGSSGGSLDMWDLREDGRDSRRMLLPDFLKDMPVLSVGSNPSISHMLAAGLDNGWIAFWDLRKLPMPLSMLQAHRSGVAGVRFRPDRSAELLSCAIDEGHIVSSEMPFTGGASGGSTWFGRPDQLDPDDGPCNLEKRVIKTQVPTDDWGGIGFRCMDVQREMLVATLLDESMLIAQLAQSTHF